MKYDICVNYRSLLGLKLYDSKGTHVEIDELIHIIPFLITQNKNILSNDSFFLIFMSRTNILFTKYYWRHILITAAGSMYLSLFYIT